MYLKSIEVHGFKSFANKLKFQFHNGITGIVGPNGSGKSNVGDAVRWVLGEQSVKQLRGSNMQDVIFSGTENRKPLGFAMVAITLDNSDHQLPVDYNEVTVTRRLYRSGESEYLINGTACRLRDVKELFYDTGIGKEGYSIIGQGQIDKILNGKPEERRELFDEAAGIVKFKRRKLAAQKKLEDENNNLTRINDILSELTRQVGPLERQSEKAKIYLKKRDELKQLDINMFLLEKERMSGQLKEVENKILISDHDMETVKGKLEQIRTEYEKIEQELESLDAAIEEKKNELNQGRMVKQQLENQIELLKEQIRSASMNDEHFQSRMEGIEESLKACRQELEAEEANRQKLKKELEEASEQEKSCLQELQRVTEEAEGLEGKIGTGRNSLIDLLGERSNTKAKLQRFETMKEQIQIRNSQLTQRMLSAKTEQNQREAVREGYQKEYDAITAKIHDLTEENAQIEAGINEIQQELIRSSKELETTKEEYSRNVSRLEALRNMTERYDGYGNSIRRVMEKKDSVAGIYGVVADLVKTEKKYEAAIETALGGSIQNIVTDNENTAKAMIEYLKKNKFGRATFLPLSAIHKKGGLGNDQALYEPGAIGVASTLVDTDDRYETLVEYLLGKTLVVDHIDHAIAISRKYRQSLRIVTLEGDLLSPGGSMSGGAFKNSSNLLGRRREMEDLETKVQSARSHVTQLQKQIEEIRQNRAAKREELVKRTEQMQAEYLNQNTLKLKLQEIQTQNARMLSDNKSLQSEANEIRQQREEIDEERIQIEKEMELSKEQEAGLETKIQGWQAELEEKRQQQEEKNRICNEVHTQTTALHQKEEFIRQNIQRIHSEEAHLCEEKKNLQENLSGSRQDVEKKEAQIQEIQESILHAQQAEADTEKELNQITEERSTKNRSHKEFFQVREDLSNQLSDLDKEHFRLDNQKERLSDYLERQINYMWEEYELTASEAEKYRDEEIEHSPQLKKMISQLKGEIKALGPVNVNAIEEYKELHERHEFLAAQHADLVKAGEDLKKIITELDEGMRRQFKEKFAIMQQEFEKAFKELFGGGKGSLELVEDEDILEAGIRIIAQPPGKKLVNMMQMSGGEKALTAIALLFAIQNMKPSPFCLLDEIEAALDENNVSRYANYLHKLTKNTQFIIITHRRGTMAVADRLYGITMQEKGVSTQVSVNMVEDELDQ